MTLIKCLYSTLTLKKTVADTVEKFLIPFTHSRNDTVTVLLTSCGRQVIPLKMTGYLTSDAHTLLCESGSYSCHVKNDI